MFQVALERNRMALRRKIRQRGMGQLILQAALERNRMALRRKIRQRGMGQLIL